jgi:hypothetical protein
VPAAKEEVATLFVGFELSKSTWLIGLYAPEQGKSISPSASAYVFAEMGLLTQRSSPVAGSTIRQSCGRCAVGDQSVEALGSPRAPMPELPIPGRTGIAHAMADGRVTSPAAA